jgi:hypothetical protein
MTAWAVAHRQGSPIMAGGASGPLGSSAVVGGRTVPLAALASEQLNSILTYSGPDAVTTT